MTGTKMSGVNIRERKQTLKLHFADIFRVKQEFRQIAYKRIEDTKYLKHSIEYIE